jgi:hypothetical protein
VKLILKNISKWGMSGLKEKDIGVSYNNKESKNSKFCIYDVIDEQLFFLSVLKYGIEFEEAK